jgi:hypothetical protein
MNPVIDPTTIQIVDLPSAFPNAKDAAYAWAQHRGITDSPLAGYGVLQTEIETGDLEIVGTYEVTYYAGAVAFRDLMIRSERDAMLQFHDLRAQYAYRIVNVYDFGGKPTVVL